MAPIFLRRCEMSTEEITKQDPQENLNKETESDVRNQVPEDITQIKTLYRFG